MAGYGLRHGRSQGMDGYTGNQFEYPIDPANTNPIFMGDVVILNGGFVEEASGGTPGAITGAILGVFMGWRDTASKGKLGGNDTPFAQYWSGAATGQVQPVAMIAMPPHSRFWVKGDAAGTYAQTDVGSRYDLTYVAGNPNTGQSATTLAAASGAAGTEPVILHRVVDLPNNTWATPEPILEVSVVLQQGTAQDVA